MRVLIVEDEEKTASYLQKGLAETGYIVDQAADGEEGLQLGLAADYDIIILDVALPRRDGWSVLTELRRAGKQTRVLFLTARDQLHDKIRGLEMGADDYLVKPFAFSELLARIRSVMRRNPAQQPETIRVADLEMDVLRHKASRGGVRLDLTPKEFQLLSLLARAPGRVFSRTTITEQVWEMNFDSDTNFLDVHIRRLRSKVDDPFAKKLIHTVRGMGYVLEER
jgi:two-component system, OmpR family, copper resistance phosphate regulon response regulator CusR